MRGEMADMRRARRSAVILACHRFRPRRAAVFFSHRAARICLDGRQGACATRRRFARPARAGRPGPFSIPVFIF